MANKQNKNQENNPNTQNGANANAQRNPIMLAHNQNRTMKEYASPTLHDFSPRIICPVFKGNNRFKMKRVMLQMLSYWTVWWCCVRGPISISQKLHGYLQHLFNS